MARWDLSGRVGDGVDERQLGRVSRSVTGARATASVRRSGGDRHGQTEEDVGGECEPVVARREAAVDRATRHVRDQSGVGEPTYRIVLSGRRMSRQTEAKLRRIIEHNNGELKWLHHDTKQRPPETHERLRVRRVDDVVTELEAAGFDVARVVSAEKR